MFIWGNSFERVKEPIVGLSDGGMMHPAERILNLLSAEGIVPAELRSSPAWHPWQLSVQVDVNPGSTPGAIRIVPEKVSLLPRSTLP